MGRTDQGKLRPSKKRLTSRYVSLARFVLRAPLLRHGGLSILLQGISATSVARKIGESLGLLFKEEDRYWIV